MKTPQSALLLVGSPKPGASSSESLGAYLLEELETHGVHGETIHVMKALRSDEATEQFLAAVAATDVVILSFPLYIDSLPAPVMRAFELVAERRAGASAGAGRQQALVAIAQCGFPEAEHNATALEICEHFAAEAGFEWAGGLTLGAGGMIGGRPLREVRGMMRSAVRALDVAAAALAAGRTVPGEAVTLMAKPAFPAFAYRFVANRQWRGELKKRGSGAPLDAQPFA